MTDMSKIRMDEFKTNVKTIVNKIILSIDENKQYIIVDDYDSDNETVLKKKKVKRKNG